MNPTYANKETRERMSIKSKKCFGARCRWRKILDRSDLTIEELEKQMDEILTPKKEKNEKER